MKKYLLLASVAGCLLSANAMAASVDPSGHSATLNVQVNIANGTIIGEAGDLEFGTLIYDNFEYETETALATLGIDGEVTSKSEHITIGDSENNAGYINAGAGDMVVTSITCANDGPTTAGCVIASNLGGDSLTLKDVTSDCFGANVSGCSIGGTLYGNGEMDHFGAINAAALKVNIAY